MFGKEWRGTLFKLVEELNERLEEVNERSEEPEKQWKDKGKKRKEESVMSSSMWLCNIGGCVFGTESKASLVNHQRQKHGPQARVKLGCQFCGTEFHPQRLQKHERACGRDRMCLCVFTTGHCGLYLSHDCKQSKK